MYLPYEHNKNCIIWKKLVDLNFIRKRKNVLFKKIDFSENSQTHNSGPN